MKTQIRLDGKSPHGPLEDGISFVHIFEHNNDDLLVVNAARGSMGRQHSVFDPATDIRLINYLASHHHWTPFAQPQFVYLRGMSLDEFALWCVQTQYYQMSRRIVKMGEDHVLFLERGSLYAYIQAGLAPVHNTPVKHSLVAHFAVDEVPCVEIEADLTPYNQHERMLHDAVHEATGINLLYDELADFLTLTLHVKMPIFVERQYFKHQILFNRNSISGRYVKLDEFYAPKEYRVQPADIKQGSLDEVHPENDSLRETAGGLLYHAREVYGTMVNEGVAKEQARMHLPLSTYTEFIETVTCSGLRRMCNQRTDSHAQREIQAYGHAIGHLARDVFPQTWTCLE